MFGANTLGRSDFYFHVFGGEVVHVAHLEFALAGRVFNRRLQRFGGGGRRDLFDRDGRVVLNLDFRPHFDAAGAVAVFARVHQSPSLEIRQNFEGLLLEDGDLGFQQLWKIVRENLAR